MQFYRGYDRKKGPAGKTGKETSVRNMSIL